MRLKRSGIEKKLAVTHERVVRAREDLSIVREQLLALSEDEEETRTRSIVTESSADRRAFNQASGHADRLRRRQEALVQLLKDLERAENELLSKLVV